MNNLIKLAILMVALSGCTVFGKGADVDRSFLTTEPCEPPCWYGIEPGSAGEKEELIDALSKLPFILEDTIRIYSVNYTWVDDSDQVEIGYQCVDEPRQSCGGIQIVDGTVAMIWTQVNYSLSFQDAAYELGEPGSFSCFEIPGHPGRRHVSVYWGRKGIIASRFDKKTCKSLMDKGLIDPELGVNTLEYVIGKKIEYLHDQNALYEWPGFADK